MKTLGITDFKTHALHVLKQVSKDREHIVITKRGKPMAEVVPMTTEMPEPGKLSDALVFEKDIVSPIGEDVWDACK